MAFHKLDDDKPLIRISRMVALPSYHPLIRISRMVALPSYHPLVRISRMVAGLLAEPQPLMPHP